MCLSHFSRPENVTGTIIRPPAAGLLLLVLLLHELNRVLHVSHLVVGRHLKQRSRLLAQRHASQLVGHLAEAGISRLAQNVLLQLG